MIVLVKCLYFVVCKVLAHLHTSVVLPEIINPLIKWPASRYKFFNDLTGHGAINEISYRHGGEEEEEKDNNETIKFYDCWDD